MQDRWRRNEGATIAGASFALIICMGTKSSRITADEATLREIKNFWNLNIFYENDHTKKILVIDDELPVRAVLEDKLKNEGFIVYLAEDGLKGLEMAEREHPDLILLDLLMPQLDGISMLKSLRKFPWAANLPVIILTNSTSGVKVGEAVESEAYDYLVKSDWKLEDVVKKIKERLNIS